MNKFSALLLCGLLAACGGGVDSDKAATESNESKLDMSQREVEYIYADTAFDESLSNPFAVSDKLKDKIVKTRFKLQAIGQLPSGKPRLTGEYIGTEAAGVKSGNPPRMYAIMNSSDGLAELKTGGFVEVLCDNLDNTSASSKYVIVFNKCELTDWHKK